MIKRTFFVSFIGYVLFFSCTLFLQLKVSEETYSGQYYIYAFLLAGLPIIGITFSLLFLMNLVIKKKSANPSTYSKVKKRYFLYGALVAIVPIIGFAIFDFVQFNEFNIKVLFFDNLMRYVPFLGLYIIVIILNRVIVWRNW
jgi:hypothetical protein